jgi:hypothetical protein
MISRGHEQPTLAGFWHCKLFAEHCILERAARLVLGKHTARAKTQALEQVQRSFGRIRLPMSGLDCLPNR